MAHFATQNGLFSEVSRARNGREAWLRMKICCPRALKVSRFLQTITNKKPFIIFFFVWGLHSSFKRLQKAP